MTAPRLLSDLVVIGYANVLLETMLPSIVAPIFQVRDTPSVILLPPYLFGHASVWNATTSDEQELQRLRTEREATVLPEPLPARANQELWVDQKWQIHYEPRAKVHDLLASIARDHIQKARAAFTEGDFEEAEHFTDIALSADDRIVDALAIKAAICRHQNLKAEERVMARLASPSVTDESFELLVRNLMENLSPAAA